MARHTISASASSAGAISVASGAPVVLLATAERWTSTARLALALRTLGCEVALLAPRDHPATICGAISLHLPYDPLRPVRSLRRALAAVQPTTILPADEAVTCRLGELWDRTKHHAGRERNELEALLTRSLGDPERLSATGSRMALQRAAEVEGVLTPATKEIFEAGDLAKAFERLGSPLVLKADASSGGRGVRIATSLLAAQRIYRMFARAPHMPRAVLRGVLHRDWTHVRSSIKRERHGVSAQTLVVGTERNATVLAHEGKVLVAECFEVVHTWKLHGPSSVLRRVHDPRMEAAIHALVQRMNITGFCGFDFIVDAKTGAPLLLERNARPTQVAHLSFGSGRDPAAAYVRMIAGRTEANDRAAATGRELIALFPQELQRDSDSAELREAFHDVPWESPALIQRVLRGDPGLQQALDGTLRAPRTQESGVSLVAG